VAKVQATRSIMSNTTDIFRNAIGNVNNALEDVNANLIPLVDSSLSSQK